MAIDIGNWKRETHWNWIHRTNGYKLHITKNGVASFYLRLSAPFGQPYYWRLYMQDLLNGVHYRLHRSYANINIIPEFRDIEYKAEKLMREGKIEKIIEENPIDKGDSYYKEQHDDMFIKAREQADLYPDIDTDPQY